MRGDIISCVICISTKVDYLEKEMSYIITAIYSAFISSIGFSNGLTFEMVRMSYVILSIFVFSTCPVNAA